MQDWDKNMNVEQKKIAFMGTSSVGKTTMLEAARKRFPNAHFVTEAARDFFIENVNIVDRFSKDTQGRIQAIALEREKEAHQSGSRVIFCDRSVLDAVVYTRENGDSEGAEELFARIKLWLPTYHKFLLLDPKDVPYAQDEIRTESEEKRNSFHRVFIEFFEAKEIPYEILSGTLEQRFMRVKEIVEE